VIWWLGLLLLEGLEGLLLLLGRLLLGRLLLGRLLLGRLWLGWGGGLLPRRHCLNKRVESLSIPIRLS
jgi:hypothetical protein